MTCIRCNRPRARHVVMRWSLCGDCWSRATHAELLAARTAHVAEHGRSILPGSRERKARTRRAGSRDRHRKPPSFRDEFRPRDDYAAAMLRETMEGRIR